MFKLKLEVTGHEYGTLHAALSSYLHTCERFANADAEDAEWKQLWQERLRTTSGLIRYIEGPSIVG